MQEFRSGNSTAHQAMHASTWSSFSHVACVIAYSVDDPYSQQQSANKKIRSNALGKRSQPFSWFHQWGLGKNTMEPVQHCNQSGNSKLKVNDQHENTSLQREETCLMDMFCDGLFEMLTFCNPSSIWLSSNWSHSLFHCSEMCDEWTKVDFTHLKQLFETFPGTSSFHQNTIHLPASVDDTHRLPSHPPAP